MIDTIILTHNPQGKKEYDIFHKLINELGYKRKIIKKISEHALIFIDTQKLYMQLKIFCIADFISVTEIDNTHYVEVYNKIADTLQQYNLDIKLFNLTRIDYKLDIHCTEQEKQEYLQAFSKARNTYYNMQKQIYKAENGNIQTVRWSGTSYNISIYDKPAERKAKNKDVPLYLQDVMRIELQMKNKAIKDYCREAVITRDLINFFHHQMREYFFQKIIIEKFLYDGDYYNLKNIRKILDKSTINAKIIKLLKEIHKKDITEALETISKPTFNKYLRELQKQNINPVMLQSLENLKGISSILKDF